MKTKKWPRRERILISTGLLLVTAPLLWKDVVNIPDFVRGLVEGAGLGLELIALIRMRRLRRAGAACPSQE